MNKLLTLVFILLFLGLSTMADIHYVKRDWLIFFSYGLTLIISVTFIVRGLSKGRKLSLVVAGLYVAVFLAICLLRLQAFDFLLGPHKADAALNHLLQWIKSPLPLMLIIAASALYQKDKAS